MKKTIFAISMLLIAYPAIPCTDISVNVYNSDGSIKNVIGSRSIDYEYGIGSKPLSFGDIGTFNTSNVNTPKGQFIDSIHACTWTNQYKFVGITGIPKHTILEGVNDRGLYVGVLYLPDFTKYPTYNKSISAKALAVYDLPTYLLGSFATVQEAIDALDGPNQKVQVVSSAMTIPLTEDHMVELYLPGHFMLQDKSGDRAVIEFISGQIKIYHNKDNNVLTNAPEYEWQKNNYLKVKQNFVPHNTDAKADGHYQNGSGYLGLPGDTTPTSRFVRASALLNAAPKAYTDNQGYYIAKTVMNANTVGLGVNPAPTIVVSTFNLGTGDYFIDRRLEIAADQYIILANQTPGQTSNIQHVNILSLNIDSAKQENMYIVNQIRSVYYVEKEEHFTPTSPSAEYKFNFVNPYKN